MNEFLQDKIKSEIIHEDEAYDDNVNYLLPSKRVEVWMHEFALQVATDAVEEEIEAWYEGEEAWKNAKYHGHFILKNIKKRLDATE